MFYRRLDVEHQLLVPPFATLKWRLNNPWLVPHENYQSHLSISRIHSIKPHIDSQFISRWWCQTHIWSSPQRSEGCHTQHERFVYESEDHTSIQMRTRPKTTRAPRCARDRRPHEHRNAHETEYHTSTECNDFRFYNNVIQVNNLNEIEITFQIRT